MTNDNSKESENKKSPPLTFHLSERSTDNIQNGGDKTADGKQNGGKENMGFDDVSLGIQLLNRPCQ